MKRGAISLILSFFVFHVLAQSPEIKTIKLQKNEIQYFFFSETKSPKVTLFGVYDQHSDVWSASKWCNELIPLAEKNHWQLIVPNITDAKVLSSFVEEFLLTDTNSKKRMAVALGAGCSNTSQILKHVSAALYISPNQDLILEPLQYPKPLIWLKTSQESHQAFNDTLCKKGYWFKTVEKKSEDPFFIDNYYQTYDDLLLELDSLSTALADTIAFENWRNKAGLQNELPEVYRQGQPIDLLLRIPYCDQIQIDVLDLSAKLIWTYRTQSSIGEFLITIPTEEFNWGVYNIEIKGSKLLSRHKIMIRG